MVVPAFGGVWDDCLVWYNGGAVDANGDGKFTPGELLDVRHAGVANAPTHGGGLMYADAQHDTVLIQTTDVCFPLQNYVSRPCPVLYFSAPSPQTNVAWSALSPQRIYGNIITNSGGIPTVNTYSTLLRFKRVRYHAINESYQIVMQLGFENLKSGILLALSNKEDDNNLYVGNSGTAFYNTQLWLEGKADWHEVAVLVDGSTIRVGLVVRDGGANGVMRWKTAGIPNAAPNPAKGLCLGGDIGAAEKTMFRGLVHMVGVWDRVLTTNEVFEAFSFHPSVFQVGLPHVDGGDLFTGNPNAPASLSSDPEDWRKFPLSLSYGNPVNITFDVNGLYDKLPQMIRLVPSAGSSGRVSVAVNGTVYDTPSLTGGKDAFVYVPVTNVLHQGENTCTVTRVSSSAAELRLNAVQMAGSWLVGWKSGHWDSMESAGNTHEDFYLESGSRWEWFRRAITYTTPLNIHLGDVLDRWGDNKYVYTMRIAGANGGGSGNKATMKLNGNIVFDSVPLVNGQVFTFELDRSNLIRGADNVIRWENAQEAGTYYTFDYHWWEVQKRPPPPGTVVIIR